MTRPRISIVTVCLNSAGTIRRTFDSVLSQGYSNIDYHVIDGVSTDGTLDILEEYSPLFEAEGIAFHWISEPDEGLYHAMNKGIGLCDGELINCLNSDDYYNAGSLDAMATASTENPEADILYGFLRVLDNGVERVVQRYNYDYFLLNPDTGIQSAAQHPTCFVRRRVYEKFGMFDTSFRTAADYEFLLRAKKGGAVFSAVDHVIVDFAVGGLSSQVQDSELLEQRYRAQFKVGLISEEQFAQRKNALRYTIYKELKSRIVRMIFKRRV